MILLGTRTARPQMSGKREQRISNNPLEYISKHPRTFRQVLRTGRTRSKITFLNKQSAGKL